MTDAEQDGSRRAQSTIAQLDPAALVRGVVVALVVVAPAAAISIALVAVRDEGEPAGVASLIAYLAILVGFGVGGRAVARSGVVLPMTHGAFVGLIAYAIAQVVILSGSSIVGREGRVSIASLALSALLASSSGMIGAMLGSRRSSRPS